MKYSKDGKVCFNPDKHTYTLGDRLLTGVTTLISRYKNKFDADLIATNYALKHGLDKEELLAKWKKEGEISCENGTAVHQVFETYILSGKIQTTGNYEKEQQAVKFINDFFLTNRLTPVEAELIVYNEYIASQIDCIAKNSLNQYFILDWKTNKKIESNGYNKFMLTPFHLYPDACFYHYSLQVCLYKKLCKEYNIKDLFIVHINSYGYEIIKAENILLPDYVLNPTN